MTRGMRRAAAAAACLGLAGCFMTSNVTIERLEPPLANVRGIKEVAILPFADSSTGAQAGRLVAERLAEVVVNTSRYRVMKIEQAEKAMARAGINFSYPPDPPMVRKIGATLGVDAVLCGELQKFRYDETGRLVKSRESIPTDDYVRDRKGNVVCDAGPGGESVPRRRTVKRTVEKNALRRSADLLIDFRFADAFLGNVICSELETESGSWEGTGPAEIAQLPTREAVFDLLLDRAAKKFVRQIAAHPVTEERVLERGTFHATNLGVELAKNNLWDEAMEKWMQSTKAKPSESAAYYNLGVGFERRGLFDLASKAYQNALARKPQSQRYIKAVAAIQKLIADLQ